MKHFVKLQNVNDSINIVERLLGKDALDYNLYPEVDRDDLKEYWGALCHWGALRTRTTVKRG